jgi:pimeloyl-ACP methyl ester carboxylesterase
MWHWTKRVLTTLLVLLATGALAGVTYQWRATRSDLAATPPPGTFVDVSGHRLHIWCTGTGNPPVILESGLGGTIADWGFVQPEVAGFTQVCSYDRAGMGYSASGPSPRTARRLAQELTKLIEARGISHPVVLVAASFGGFVARVFASEHEDRVAGLVLVDASHEDQTHEIPRVAPFVPLLSALGVFRLAGISFGLNTELVAPSVRGFARATSFRTTGYNAAANEILHIRESAAEVRASRRVLTMPVVVVTGVRGLDATWRNLQRDQVGLSAAGCQIMAAESGHLIPVQQPQAIVGAIRAVVETARDGRTSVSSAARPLSCVHRSGS